VESTALPLNALVEKHHNNVINNIPEFRQNGFNTYENYGIYTMLNHTFGRYGLTINGAVLDTDYADKHA
jgi:hypothetical protein